MNKQTLINKAAYESLLKKGTIEKLFDRMFEIIRESVREEGKFEIEEFGSFKVAHKVAAKYFDEGKKQFVAIPPKDKIVFTPSQFLNDRINKKRDEGG